MNQTNGNTPSDGANLMQNEYVQEVFTLLQSNGKDTQGLTELIGHVSEMEGVVKRADDMIAAMKKQLDEMKEVQNHPIKAKLQAAIKSLEVKVAQLKVQISELKQNIVEGCKSAVEAFKVKGAAALNGIAKFFRVKKLLKAIDKNCAKTAAQCDKSIADINKFASNYHTAGLAVKNMGRIITGKEPLDQKKENGKLARTMIAPYKAHKSAINGLKKAVAALAKKLEQLDASVEIRRNTAERKPGILDELEVNLKKIAEQDLTRTAPVKVKGAELT